MNDLIETGRLLIKLKEQCIVENKRFHECLARMSMSKQKSSELMRAANLSAEELAGCETWADLRERIKLPDESTTSNALDPRDNPAMDAQAEAIKEEPSSEETEEKKGFTPKTKPKRRGNREPGEDDDSYGNELAQKIALAKQHVLKLLETAVLTRDVPKLEATRFRVDLDALFSTLLYFAGVDQ
jgi:hypothetical protein